MHICFVDESSTPPKPSSRRHRPYFVIAGVSVPISQWRGLADEFHKLKERPEFRVRGEVKWRYFGTANNDHRNTVAHLDSTKRDMFRDSLFNLLSARNSVRAFAAVTDVERYYRKYPSKTQDDLYADTYKPVTERFQYHLQDISRASGSTHFGLIVADHRGRDDDERMRRHHQKLLYAKSPYISDYKNLVESLFLTPSHHSIGIQFADMLAGAVSRFFNSADPRWFDAVKPILRSRPDGNIDGYGLVKVPNNW